MYIYESLMYLAVNVWWPWPWNHNWIIFSTSFWEVLELFLLITSLFFSFFLSFLPPFHLFSSSFLWFIIFLKKWKSHFTHVQLWPTFWSLTHQAPYLWNFPSKNTGVGNHSPTQGSNPDHLHCPQFLYCLRQQGSSQYNFLYSCRVPHFIITV